MSQDNARKAEPTLDIRDLPKVTLHEHLDGGLRPSTIIDLSAAAGLNLPASEPDDLADWFVDSARAGSLERYLETFAVTLAVMQTAENLTRIAREYVEDLVQDGVVYAEVRWAPEQHQEQGLTLDQAIAAVTDGFDQGMVAAEADGHDILVTQIITAMRQGSRSEEVAMTALRHRDAGVVGFDLAGPEAGFPASAHKPALDLLAEQLFPVTIHAGEGDGLASIRSALVDGRALRLGHGVRIAEDLEEEVDVDEDGESIEVLSAGEIATWVRDRGIALEVCPSSNLDTRATAAWGEDLASHPIDLLHQAGFVVTVSPDNRLMSDTTVSDELAQLVETFDYDVEDLLQFTLNAVEASFLGLDDKQDLAETIVETYDELLEGSEGANA
ncbi:MAG: adenosine deaminase [Galactobacter sp.]